AFEISRNYSYLFKDSIRYCILFYLLFTAIGFNNSFLSILTSFDLEAKRMIQLQHFGHFLQEKFIDRKSTRLNSSHVSISYAVFCLKKKKIEVWLSIVKRNEIADRKRPK